MENTNYLKYNEACAYIALYVTETGNSVMTSRAYDNNLKGIQLLMHEAAKTAKGKAIDEDEVIAEYYKTKGYKEILIKSGLTFNKMLEDKTILEQPPGFYMLSIGDPGDPEAEGHVIAIAINKGEKKNSANVVMVIGNNETSLNKEYRGKNWVRTLWTKGKK